MEHQYIDLLLLLRHAIKTNDMILQNKALDAKYQDDRFDDISTLREFFLVKLKYVRMAELTIPTCDEWISDYIQMLTHSID